MSWNLQTLRANLLAALATVGAVMSSAMLIAHSWHGEPWRGFAMALAASAFVLAVLGTRPQASLRGRVVILLLCTVSALLAAVHLSGLAAAFPPPNSAPPLPPWLDSLAVAGSFLLAYTTERAREDHVVERLADERECRADMERVRAQAEDANRAKSVFLANMSHELRTPLSAIIGLLDLSLEEHPTHELKLAQRSAGHLLGIVNDILDLSKIESGELSLAPAPTDLGELVRDVVELARLQAHAQDLKVELELDLDGWPVRLVDGLRLKQVLHNLLSNAVKFSERGPIRVRVVAAGDQVHVEVCDRGMGMTADQVARAFQAFQQGQDASSRRHGGAGLGLTLVHSILERMDTELQIESQPGQGTRVGFVVILTRSRMMKGHALTLPPTRFHARPMRILVAEDNPLNQLIARRQLEAHGHHVEVANDGVEAVKAAFDGWDIILMDVQMPNLDGRDATRKIRELEREKRRDAVSIVALTANAMHGDEEACIDAGMDGFLPKPLNIPALDRILLRLAAKHVA